MAEAAGMHRCCSAHSLLRHVIPMQLRGSGSMHSLLRHAFLQCDGLIAVALRSVAAATWLPLSPRVLFADALQCLLDGAHTQRDVRARFDAAHLECRRLLALDGSDDEHNDNDDDCHHRTRAHGGDAARHVSTTTTLQHAAHVLQLLQPYDVAAMQRHVAYADESEWCGAHSRQDIDDDDDDDSNSNSRLEQLRRLAVQHHPYTRLLCYELCMAAAYYALLLGIDDAYASATMALRVALTADVAKDRLLVQHMNAFAQQPRHVITGARVTAAAAAASTTCLSQLTTALLQQQQKQQQTQQQQPLLLSRHDDDDDRDAVPLPAATERFVAECVLLERDILGQRRFDLRGARGRFLLHCHELSSVGKTPLSFALVHDALLRRVGNIVLQTTPVYDGRWLRHELSCGVEDHRIAPALLPPSTCVVTTSANTSKNNSNNSSNNNSNNSNSNIDDETSEHVRLVVRYDQPLCPWQLGEAVEAHVMTPTATLVHAAAANIPQQQPSRARSMRPHVEVVELAVPDTTRSWLARYFLDR